MIKKQFGLCLLIIGTLILAYGIWCFIAGLLNEGGNIKFKCITLALYTVGKPSFASILFITHILKKTAFFYKDAVFLLENLFFNNFISLSIKTFLLYFF